MRLALSSVAWSKIYYRLSNEYDRSSGRKSIEDWFKHTHEIIINTDQDGNWLSVDIDDNQLVMLLLQVGVKNEAY